MLNVDLRNGDCLEVLKTIPDNSIDSIVTDPPYGLSFMNKKWDYDVPKTEVWQECLRVLKPGGHLLAFAGTRTQHRMAVRIEDAGFEIRDMIAWCYSTGFPKSMDVSKQIDQQEKNRWVKISNAIDNASLSEIAELWINSKNANAAGLSFRRKQTEAGLNTQKKGFAHGSVLLQASHKNCDALVVIAELNSTGAHPTSGGSCSSAQSNAESTITASKSHANTAESSPENREAALCMVDFSALHSAWGWQGESKADKLKAVEALKIWLGSKPSSSREATSALCAALTDDLKLITLSQSKTFLSFDTTRQMACASVISATITESTAASLISFTANTLRSKAIDKRLGAERKILSERKRGAALDPNGEGGGGFKRGTVIVSEPAPDLAKKWEGWGTSLKPAIEPITVARKPLAGAVVDTIVEYGTGAINIDGCRVPTNDKFGAASVGGRTETSRIFEDCGWKRAWMLDDKKKEEFAAKARETAAKAEMLGRFPANLIHDGSDEVVAMFPESKGAGGSLPQVKITGYGDKIGNGESSYFGGERTPFDSGSGSAARFFNSCQFDDEDLETIPLIYCAKASKADRESGFADSPIGKAGSLNMRTDKHSEENGQTTAPRANIHPTVKPTALMRHLIRLVTPPGGTTLDPFTGSGTTGKAAMLEGMSFIGIELSPEYFEIASKRILHARDNKSCYDDAGRVVNEKQSAPSSVSIEEVFG